MKFSVYFILLITLSSCGQEELKEAKKSISYLQYENSKLYSDFEQKEKELQIQIDVLRSQLEDCQLYVQQNQKIASGEYFSIGSTKKDVIRIMGDPLEVTEIGPFTTFYYSGSMLDRATVGFENGRVKDYNNVAGKLKIKIKTQ